MLVLTFQVGTERLALDARRVKAVVPRVPLRVVAGSPEWLAGVFVYQGAIVPVVDLHRLAGSGECVAHLSSRIILVQDPASEERLIGLLAARVDSLQEVKTATAAAFTISDSGDLGPVLVEGNEILRMVDLKRLLPDATRRQIVAQETRA